MKLLVSVLILFVLASEGFAGEISKGMSRTEVVEQLGEPQGLISAGEYELLDYERGRVELQDGEVVAAELMTPEELEVAKKEAAERRAARRRRAEERRRERHKRGRELKRELVNSPKFGDASGKEKVEVLKRFHKKYPQVDIKETLRSALAEKKEEVAAEAEEKRLARIEDRVDQAENRAQRAEWRALEAERDARNSRRMRYYRNDYRFGNSSRRRHSPGNFGLSVGYEAPEMTINYSHGSRYTHRRHIHKRRTGTRAISDRKQKKKQNVAGERLRSTSSTTRFNDGF